jgi:hypothetical protein
VRQQDLPARVRPNLDKVYAFLRAHDDLRLPGAHNVFLYRHDVRHERDGKMHVEFGVQVRGPFAQTGEVFASATPAGRIAKATHIGPYQRLGETHGAIQRWCKAAQQTLVGIEWEVYGDWTDDPTKLETTVCYLLAERVAR